MPTCRLAIVLAVLGASVAVLLNSAAALPLSQPLPSDSVIPIAEERWSVVNENSWISYHVDMIEGVSFIEQYLYQEVLAMLLLSNAGELPGVRPCEVKVKFLDRFGDFAIGAGHPSPMRRLDCLRGAVGYLLRQPIGDVDFVATGKDRAYGKRMGFSSNTYAQQLALLTIYQKGSPLYQIHSITPDDLADVPFENFDAWLRRSRERKLITFRGKRALLDSLDLPAPDPMVWRPTPSLKSPRVPAGVIFFEGERLEVPALIMLIC
jgi:hypothetical protein